MLRLKDIRKEYPTGAGAVHALRGVSLDFRDSEFVAVLGPSGCGKTTLLNIVGGLDSYTSGDLEINGISTSTFKDAQWDAYRNHDVGFVFQTYNLISHQTVLANVELALKLSHELTASMRRAKALAALERVGLADQVGKKPTMLSGGQMQRVAIARALVNDPTIILADEPTGALDSETSVQIMDILREVARDHLVVMVTHNPELADEYATRIVRLKDGAIVSDSNPLREDELAAGTQGTLPKRSRLRMPTALSLSLTNLLTKKGRTFLTAFAGAIGIIGIALILSISNGVNTYIDNLQRTTMTSYPITIEQSSYDLASMMFDTDLMDDTGEPDHDLDAVYSDVSGYQMDYDLDMGLVENNLTAFKAYLDDPSSEIHQYLGENGVVYSYDTSFGVYSHDKDGVLVDADGVTFGSGYANMGAMMSGSGSASDADLSALVGMSTSGVPGAFSEMLCASDGTVASAVRDSYDLLAGEWPDAYDEVVLVVGEDNELPLNVLFELGLLPSAEYEELNAVVMSRGSADVEQESLSYDDVLAQTLYLIPASDQYVEQDDGTYAYVGDDADAIEGMLDDALELRITGIVRANGSEGLTIDGDVGYTADLTRWVVEQAEQSDVVAAQEATPDTDVLTGLPFGEGVSSYLTPNTYEDNLKAFGLVSLDSPSSISLYADSFEDKDGIAQSIDAYNASASEEDQISYTDYISLLTSSITTIISAISYVLIAFVAISLIVSSIMIAIITYISVLERTKEIGVLRALGASKGDVSKIFNAETLIEGLLSGLIGVGVAALLCIPITAIIQAIAEVDIVIALPILSAVVLVCISVAITLVAGFIPSRMASKKDPAVALRSE